MRKLNSWLYGIILKNDSKNYTSFDNTAQTTFIIIIWILIFV